jgi:uncharacterized membrane protein (DUF485 family)
MTAPFTAAALAARRDPVQPRRRTGKSGSAMAEQDGSRDAARYDEVLGDPRYQRLVQRRGRFTWTLSIVMLVAYFGYVALIAFDKALLARPIGGGVTSLGIPVGVGIILLAILLTGLYVRRANREFDPLVKALRDGDGE